MSGPDQHWTFTDARNREVAAVLGLAKGHNLRRSRWRCRLALRLVRLRAASATRSLLFPDLADKSKTPTGDRADEALLLAAISNRMPGGVYPAGERGI